ncbi:hypothetical protein F5Y13DRAFT_164573 [Hypoxylon sp. FL1857]|nr:hypothetical protein F5Y13DRAFT_164573 [Hypoxylon sp. FL1857]
MAGNWRDRPGIHSDNWRRRSPPPPEGGMAMAYRPPGPAGPGPELTPEPSLSSGESEADISAPRVIRVPSRTLQGRVSKPPRPSSVRSAQSAPRQTSGWRQQADALQAAVARQARAGAKGSKGSKGKKRKRRDSLLGDVISALDNVRRRKR